MTEHTEAFHIWIARSPEGELRQVRNELDTFVAKIIVYEDECIEVEFSKDDFIDLYWGKVRGRK